MNLTFNSIVESRPVRFIMSLIALMRLNQPDGYILLVTPGIAAYLVASDGYGSWLVVMMLLMGGMCGRICGCVINDYLDRGFDAQVERTRYRPLASGDLHGGHALGVLVIFAVLGLLILFYGLPGPYVQMLMVGFIPLIFLYPLAKRYVALPQAVLAVVFASGVVLGWAAGDPDAWPWESIPFYLATMLWTFYFDTCYAMADMADDKRQGLNSAALYFEDKLERAVQVLAVSSLIGWVLVWLWYDNLSAGFGFTLPLIGLCYAYQFLTVKFIKTDRGRTAKKMFRSNSVIGLLLNIGVYIDVSHILTL